MIECVHLIDKEAKSLLKSLVGKTLKTIEGYWMSIYLNESRGMFGSKVRLRFSDGSAYDLRNDYVSLPFDDGFCTDTGALSFDNASGSIWLPDGTPLHKLSFNFTIDEIVLVNDLNTLKHENEVAGTYAFTRGIALRSGDKYLVLTMDNFPEDSIFIRSGASPEELIPENPESMYDEPGWADDYTREYERV